MWGEDDSVPPAGEYIDRTFGQGGYLHRRWGEGYQPRAGQVALARAVDESIRERTHLLSEAPCGIGKSLGYSVPASYHAATSQKTIVIVTANIALQEQIVGKDLPLLAEILPWGFSYALLKGRQNYLCRSMYEQIRLDSRQKTMFADMGGSTEERDRRRLMQWAEGEIGGGYGDVSSLDWKPSDKMWRELSVSAEDCKGPRCSFKETCGALAAQRRARQSQVIVTNYHLFFTNLLIAMERGIDVVLPPFDVAIFDEAHKASDISRDFFGWKVSESSPKRPARYFRNQDPAFVERISRASACFFGQMLVLRRDRDRYKARIVPEKLSRGDLSSAEDLIGLMDELGERLAQEFDRLVDNPGRQARDELGTVEIAQRKALKVRQALQSVLEPTDDNQVLYIEEDEFRKAHVSCRLVRPGKVLRSALFEKVKQAADGTPPSSVAVVCTSATMATADGFGFAATELGVERYKQLVVDSPFDFQRQALFIVPELCEPNDPAFTAQVAATLLRTIELARGRTLAFFTSRKRMNDVFDFVSPRCQPYRIIKQDDGQRTQLIEEFRRDTHSVLMGVSSFWAGVDVPGESLSVVFIDKLPFPTPDDPVLERLSETDKRAFGIYAVPRAIIEFKQGFGRLIRSSTDRGAVVCCDNRLLTKGYGRQFLKAMPNVQKIKNLGAIPEWLDGPVEEEVDPLS